MSERRGTTLLEHALLGLLYGKPSSGYDLRKIFATTSMGSFSDSPGAIYPALRRLEKRELVKSRPQADSGRRRQIVSLTPKGMAELKTWIAKPVTPEEILGKLGEFMLRFAFSEPVLGAAAAVELLQGLENALRAVLSSLQEQMKTLKPVLPLSGSLALESGVRGHQSLLEWCEHAQRAYATGGSIKH